MRILFVGNINIPTLPTLESSPRNGRVEQLAEFLHTEGHQVAVSCVSFPYQRNLSRYRGIALYHVPSLTGEMPVGYWQLILSLVRARIWRAEVIHTQGWSSAGLLWLAKLLQPRARVVVTVDDFAPPLFGRQRLRDRWRGWQLRAFAQSVSTPTREIQYHLLTHYGIAAAYIPDGYTSELSLRAARRHPAAPRGRYGVLLCQRFNDLRGIRRAYSRIRSAPPLLVVTLGQEPLGVARNSSGKIRTLSIRGPRELATLLQPATFTLVAGGGVSATILLAAMEAGNAVIAEAYPAYEEVLGVTGQYIHPRDWQSLSGIITAMMRSKSKPASWGRLARRRAQAHFRWSRILPEYSSLYREAESKIILLDSAQSIPFTRPVLS